MFGNNYGNNFYNPYNPYDYRNYNQQQPQMAPNQPQNNQGGQINQFAYVNGIEGAKSFQLAPGRTILLLDSDNPLIYFKASNELGQSTLKYFTINEIDEISAKQSIGGNVKTTPQIDVNNFVSRNDFDALVEKYETLSKKLDKITNKTSSKEA